MILGFDVFIQKLQYCFNNNLPASNSEVQRIIKYWNFITESLEDKDIYSEIKKFKPLISTGIDMNQTGRDDEMFGYLQDRISNTFAAEH
ncbi:hypothetical protein AGMMS49579_06710 [Spirochaetia bacterium]|nr:hypothetical protein AGMMS49579_06710 [Spirochaetia bacterium]